MSQRGFVSLSHNQVAERALRGLGNRSLETRTETCAEGKTFSRRDSRGAELAEEDQKTGLQFLLSGLRASAVLCARLAVRFFALR
jgi:hypothetical protein